MWSITSEDDNVGNVAAELTKRLVDYNERRAGPLRARKIALTVRTDEGELIAGLVGEAFWNALYIDILWVDERHQRQGYGRALLNRAEDFAARHLCDCVYLSTFDFQAPDFYKRNGYMVIGELAGVPSGSRRQWLCKTIHGVD